MQHQIYTKPSEKAAELLAAHIADADRLLPPATSRLLRFILKMPAPAEPDPGIFAPAPADSAQATAADVDRPTRRRWLRR
jgi:hypothetical protein